MSRPARGPGWVGYAGALTPLGITIGPGTARPSRSVAASITLRSLPATPSSHRFTARRLRGAARREVIAETAARADHDRHASQTGCDRAGDIGFQEEGVDHVGSRPAKMFRQSQHTRHGARSRQCGNLACDHVHWRHRRDRGRHIRLEHDDLDLASTGGQRAHYRPGAACPQHRGGRGSMLCAGLGPLRGSPVTGGNNFLRNRNLLARSGPTRTLAPIAAAASTCFGTPTRGAALRVSGRDIRWRWRPAAARQRHQHAQKQPE